MERKSTSLRFNGTSEIFGEKLRSIATADAEGVSCGGLLPAAMERQAEPGAAGLTEEILAKTEIWGWAGKFRPKKI